MHVCEQLAVVGTSSQATHTDQRLFSFLLVSSQRQNKRHNPSLRKGHSVERDDRTDYHLQWLLEQPNGRFLSQQLH